ncbi:twin-arginine translocase TatA/TatE family subunit [Coraliomargarita sinensis]|uniref:Sec-independent protein translocase protein TatA n=2 Tax=Coraliomargarita sinensis TaxID=2174842 RepID=A0A317ZI12_9BACT|nr:twin-arginine translocase TatA/TatE family subunit [Coraliomargarita sinensis]
MNAPEIVMILAVILLFFGAKRLPELMRSVGKSIGEFKRAKDDIEKDVRSAMESAEAEPERKQSIPEKARVGESA